MLSQQLNINIFLGDQKLFLAYCPDTLRDYNVYIRFGIFPHMDKLRAVCITSNKGKYRSFVLTMSGPVQWRYMDFEASKMTGKSTVSFTINSNVLQENYRNCIIGLFEGNPPKFAS